MEAAKLVGVNWKCSD